MDTDNSDLANIEYFGRVKTQTFKQYQLERLLREGKVIPAPKLAEAKEEALQRFRDFDMASEDERRHSSAAPPPPKDKLENMPLTRERFDE